MAEAAKICSGGGWEKARTVHVRIKAWVMLFSSIALGGVAINGADSWLLYVGVPAGISLILSVILFFREKPREVVFPHGRSGGDIQKLHGACDSNETNVCKDDVG
jgi:hypothetical protein